MIQMRTHNIAFGAMLVKSREPIQQERFEEMPAYVKEGFRKGGQLLKQYPQNDKLYMKFILNPYSLSFNTVGFVKVKEGESIPKVIDENSQNVRTISVEALSARPDAETVAQRITNIYRDLSD